MFRLIAIALISTFALLGMMVGDDSATGGAQRGGVDFGSRPAAKTMIGGSYVVAAPALLIGAPEPAAETLIEVGTGTRLLMLASDPQGFARVRDPVSGYTGYIDASALAALP